jgi:hypothetical protein
MELPVPVMASYDGTKAYIQNSEQTTDSLWNKLRNRSNNE